MDRNPGGRLPRRLPDLGITPTATTWSVPPDELTDIGFTDVHLDHGHRLTGRMSTYRGALADFALTLLDESGQQIARADCDHGYVHVHAPDQLDRRRAVRDIREQADVAAGWDQAYAMMLTYSAAHAGRSNP